MTKKTVDWFIILLNICKFYINYASLDVLIVFTSKSKSEVVQNLYTFVSFACKYYTFIH